MFNQGVIVKKKENGFYRLELWGASSKHPDSVFDMEDFEMAFWVDKTSQEEIDGQVFQWLCECASKLTFPFHAANLVKYALENWRLWDK